MIPDTNRRVIPVSENFFCDGPWYTLTSSDLGGSGLSAANLAERLQDDDPGTIKALLETGTCLPLFFPGDCALDDSIIVVGDLNEEEEREWIGRLRSTLKIPSGEFALVAGGMEENFEAAMMKSAPDIDDHDSFEKVKVDPGNYLVEIYAYLGSLVVNEEWEEIPEDVEPIREWWARTRTGQNPAKWITALEEEEYVDSEDFELVEYIIRLKKLEQGDALIPAPGQDENVQWCNGYEFRRPDPCPLGLPQSRYRGE